MNATIQLSELTPPEVELPGVDKREAPPGKPARQTSHQGDIDFGVRADLARRILNFCVALVGLIVFAPVLLILALLVRLTSPGPIFYIQTRVGLDRRHRDIYGGNGRRRIDYGGRLFRIYKFRTMQVAAPNAKQVWAQRDDPRVTPIGRVLRKYRLDELPQLFNVLRGDMNIVGPRPEQPKIFVDLRDQIERYTVRQRVLPGITGWAQVNQHYDRCIEDVRNKVRLDLEYIERQSALEDLRIMARTVPSVIFRENGW